MNIGKLDILASVYERTVTQNEYGETTLGSSAVEGKAWVKRINKSAKVIDQGGSVMIAEAKLEFLTRYNTTLWEVGKFFTINENTSTYYIRGVEQVGRKKALMITAETYNGRNE